MLILGIESSCDDTSVALLQSSEQGHIVLAEKTASQIDLHAHYGGVVPELAGRAHAEHIMPLIETVLQGQPKPEVIAVTSGPGLVTGLLVGVEAARALSYSWGIPLIGVNHIEGHIHGVEIPASTNGLQQGGRNPNDLPRLASFSKAGETQKDTAILFPALCLVVSGGHTELILMRDHGVYEILGATKDDAAGECFDKIAKLLDLPYPGGPKISALAEQGNPHAIHFPRPMMDQPNFAFSFSGLKTAVLYYLRDHKESAGNPTIADICASAEQAIVDVLVHKTKLAIAQFHPRTVILAGGVAANKKLRHTLAELVASSAPNTELRTPLIPYCMDNAAMIAVAGYYQAQNKHFVDWCTLTVNPVWRIDD